MGWNAAFSLYNTFPWGLQDAPVYVSLPNTPLIQCGSKDSTTGRTTANINGGTESVSVTAALNIPAGSNSLIGAGAGLAVNGLIGEIIVTSSLAFTDNRQRLEGYLAWKWGLEANLPANHPYKLLPPTV
jgi:hypothetical protein